MDVKNPSPVFDGHSTQVPEINNFLEAEWRLPMYMKALKYHRGYVGAGGNGITYARNWLGTKFGITDPVVKHQFPSYAQSIIRGLIHVYRKPTAGFAKRQWDKAANVLDDSRAADFLKIGRRGAAPARNTPADWFKLRLLEPKPPEIKVWKHGLSSFYANEARNIRFAANIPYQLVLMVGRGAEQIPPDLAEYNVIARALVTSDATLPQAQDPTGGDRYNMAVADVRWFKIGLYVPDHVVLQMMEPHTKSYYRRITGRARGDGDANYNAKEDIYWHLSGWERALEAAKIPGWVVKTAVTRATPGLLIKGVGYLAKTAINIDKPIGPNRNFRNDVAMRGDGAGDIEAHPGTYAMAVWNGTTDSFNRKSIVPPNFCFVKFNAVLYITVIAVNQRA